MRSKMALAAVLVILAGANVVQAAVSMAVSQTSELPEIQVTGNRLYQLRRDIIRSEDRFFAAFNKLNTDHDFDIHCSQQTPLGTHIQSRVCRVKFYEKAQEDEARAWVTGDFSAPPAHLIALQRSAEYQQKALAVINAHPELLRMIREREALEKKFDAVRKARFKGRWFLFGE